MALTTAQQLEAARAAYHKLMTGQAAETFVDQNGEQIRFTRMNANSLLSYIQRLEAQIAAGDSTPAMPRAIGVWF